MRSLAQARGRRKVVDLHDLAMAHALATHDPKSISTALAAPLRPSQKAIDEGEFETKKWWRTSD